MTAKHVKYTSALDTIGNTPIIKLQKIVPDSCAKVYAKLEMNTRNCRKIDYRIKFPDTII